MKVNNQNRFEVTFDKAKFSLLNKDRKISWLFRSSEVGKCVKLFDDYYNSEQVLTPKGWFLFYKSVMGVDILKEVSNKIMEITKYLKKI